MLKKSIEEALNKQVMREMYSSNLYLAMSSYFHTLNLNGFANWMRVQAQEEMTHAMKIFDYIISRGGQAIVSSIEAPPTKWDSPLDAFNSAYNHEQLVTAWINEITDLAIAEKDHPTHLLMQWFINEQVEEEANTLDIVERLKLVADSKSGLFMLDNELKQRQFVDETAGASE